MIITQATGTYRHVTKKRLIPVIKIMYVWIRKRYTLGAMALQVSLSLVMSLMAQRASELICGVFSLLKTANPWEVAAEMQPTTLRNLTTRTQFNCSYNQRLPRKEVA